MKPFPEGVTTPAVTPGAAPGTTQIEYFDPAAIVDQMNGSKLSDSLGAQVALTARAALQKVRELNTPEAAGSVEESPFLAQAVVAALGVIPSQKAMGVSEALLFAERVQLLQILHEIQVHVISVVAV